MSDMTGINLLATINRAEGNLTSAARANARSVVAALDVYGARTGLDQPHRLVPYLGQISHESMGFVYDREVWGPTPAQKRYEGRKDLGNTRKGDGRKFSGHGPIQVTGRANHAGFRDWCRKNIDPSAPDFEESPDMINTDPWEGLTGIWYWSTRDLNRYADFGDIEMITKRINGGLNGYQDRIDRTVRYGLVLLGRDPGDVRGFQKTAGLAVDGVAGPQTRAALHKALVALTRADVRAKGTRSAPVIEETTVEKPVVPQSVDEAVQKTSKQGGWLSGLGAALGTGLSAVLGADWQTVAVIGASGLGIAVLALAAGPLIVSRIKAIRSAVEAGA